MKYLPMAFFNKIRNVKVAKFDTFTDTKIKLNDSAFIHTDGEILSTCAKQVYVKLQNEFFL